MVINVFEMLRKMIGNYSMSLEKMIVNFFNMNYFGRMMGLEVSLI